MRKIENLTRQKIKEAKSHEENELKLKEKQKVQISLQTKVKELNKLILIRNKDSSHNKSLELSPAEASLDMSKIDSLLSGDVKKGKQDEGVGDTPKKNKSNRNAIQMEIDNSRSG